MDWMTSSLYDIITIGFYMNIFIFYDKWLHDDGYLNPYYAIHAMHNAFIVYLTAGDVFATISDFSNISSYPTNSNAVKVCIALHAYHLLMYWRSFRMDDWLHHGLMIGVAIPIGLSVDSHTLMGFSLFFTTGLPGGIDYALLFGVRNGWMNKMTEKRINTLLNVWVRSPGCIAQAILTLVYCLQSGTSFMSVIPALLNYWNGQYFMEKVISDYSVRRLSESSDD